MFYHSDSKYSRIVKMDTISNAKKAITELRREFNSAVTRPKKMRILKVVNLATNRAKVMSKNQLLKPVTRREKAEIHKLYKKFKDQLKKKVK